MLKRLCHCNRLIIGVVVMLISPNQIFATDDLSIECFRVVAILPKLRGIYIIDLLQDTLPRYVETPVLEGRIIDGEIVQVADEPSQIRVLADSELSAAQRRIRDARYSLIQNLVEESEFSLLDPALRHGLLSKVAIETGSALTRLYEFIRIWWRGGQLRNSLAPPFHRCGALGQSRRPGTVKLGRPNISGGVGRGPGVNVTDDIREKLLTGIPALKKGMSWPAAYTSVMANHFLAPDLVDGRRVALPSDQRPTEAQFKYQLSKYLSPADIERAVRGAAAFERNRSDRTGFTRDIPFGPGDIYQIDASIANIFLKGRFNPDVFVGKPTVYLVTDQSSGIIAGATAAIGNPSWDVAKLALEHAFTDKVDSCKQIGIDITSTDWPCHHLPKQLTCDRGRELIGFNAGTSTLGLDIVLANLPAFRPDLKGLVENKFEWLDHDSIKWAPGATHGRNRGDIDDRPHELDGIYDLDSFWKFLIHCIILHNAKILTRKPPEWYPIHAEGSPVPNEIWEYGCIHRGSPRTAPKRLIRANLLPQVIGKITNSGLKVGRLYYIPPNSADLEMFYRISGRAWSEVFVRQDPRNVTTILVPERGGEFSIWKLAPAFSRYVGWSLNEVSDAFAILHAVDELKKSEILNADVRFKENVERLNKQVRQDTVMQTKAIGTTKPMRKRRNFSADKDARRTESQQRKSEGAWLTTPKSEIRSHSPEVVQPKISVSMPKMPVEKLPSKGETTISKLNLLQSINKDTNDGNKK